MRISYSNLKSQYFRNIGVQSTDPNIVNVTADFNQSLGARYQMILAKMADYRTQKTYTDTTAIGQQFYSYPVGLVNFESVVVSVGSVNYPLTVINSQFSWDVLNAIPPIQISAIPQYVFPRNSDYGIWPIPQAPYTITFNYHWRDRNLSVADYNTGTVAVTNRSIPFVSTNYQVVSGTTDVSGIATLGQIENPYPNSIFFEIASPANHPAQTITAGNGFAIDSSMSNVTGTVWSSALAYKIVSGTQNQQGAMTFPKSQSQAFNSMVACFNGTPSLAVVSATSTKKVNTTTLNTTMNLSQLPTVGNVVVIAVTSAHATAPVITDNQTNNTYQQIGSGSTTSTGPNIFLYYGVVNTSAGTFTITVTGLNATVGDSADIFAMEVSGLSNVNASTITGSGTTFTPAMVGRWFSVTDPTESGQGFWYRIAGYNSATSLTLFRSWQGNTGSGYTYNIGETPELPEELHMTLVHGATADFYANMKNDEATAARWENRFWTGDPSNGSRAMGDSNVIGGVIGAMNKYEDRNESHLVNRNPHPDPLGYNKVFAIKLS